MRFECVDMSPRQIWRSEPQITRVGVLDEHPSRFHLRRGEFSDLERHPRSTSNIVTLPIRHESTSFSDSNPNPVLSTYYIVSATRLAGVPPSRPCHSANSNASLICSSGNLCDTTLATGIRSCTRTRNCNAASMIQGL